MSLTNTFRFKSWQLVRLRGRGPFGGSAWRVAAHIYRDRAINCMDGLRMAQEDLRTFDTAYTEAEQTIAQLRAALEGAGRVAELAKAFADEATFPVGCCDTYMEHSEDCRYLQAKKALMEAIWAIEDTPACFFNPLAIVDQLKRHRRDVPMKRAYAEDIAMSLFDWDYSELSDQELYAALEEQGYDWNGASWEYE